MAAIATVLERSREKGPMRDAPLASRRSDERAGGRDYRLHDP